MSMRRFGLGAEAAPSLTVAEALEHPVRRLAAGAGQQRRFW
jgi:hypothetical protein